LHGSLADLLYFFCGEQPHSVDQHQIRHSSILFVQRCVGLPALIATRCIAKGLHRADNI
jgi:hypothetical protein